MEKVPNLSMFSQRQLKKSSSLSRINNDNNYRPSNSNQTNNMKNQDYYGEALKLLNTDSQITTKLKNIENRHDQDGWKKTNIKKIAKHRPFQNSYTSSNNYNSNSQNVVQLNPKPQPQPFNFQAQPHTYVQSQQVLMNNTPKVSFNQHPTMIKTQNFQPIPSFLPNANSFQPVQIQQVPFHIIPQNQQMQYPNNMRLVNHPVQVNQNLPPSMSMQRSNSVKTLNFGNYSQSDKIITKCNISPVCNNEQEKNTQGKKEYTFRKNNSKNEIDSPVKTHNPFLFDATYLLQIKQSESRLPDITSLISNKQYCEQLDKKQQLLQQLQDIRQENVVQSKQFLNKLDCLINQFQPKQVKVLEESVMRNSRRSLFAKIE